MTRFLQILRVKARADPQRKPPPHHNIIPHTRNPSIIHLCLGKATRIQPILARNLQPDPLPRLTIPRHLRPGFEHAIHLLEKARANHANIIRRCDRGVVDRRLIPDGSLIPRNCRFLNIIPGFRAEEEAPMPDDEVDIGDGALEQVDEGARVDVGLLVVQVGLGADVLAVGEEGGQQLELDAGGDGVVRLDLGVEGVLRVPADGGGGA